MATPQSPPSACCSTCGRVVNYLRVKSNKNGNQGRLLAKCFSLNVSTGVRCDFWSWHPDSCPLASSPLQRCPSFHHLRMSGNAVFIARVVWRGSAVPLSIGVGHSTRQHPDRIKEFPVKERLLVESPSPDSVNRQWRHELDHDAESVFWLLLLLGCGRAICTT